MAAGSRPRPARDRTPRPRPALPPTARGSPTTRCPRPRRRARDTRAEWISSSSRLDRYRWPSRGHTLRRADGCGTKLAKVPLPSARSASRDAATCSARRRRAHALPLAVGRRRRLLHQALDRLLLQQPHAFLHRLLELRVVAGDDVLRPVLDVDVGRDALVLDRPLAVAIEEAAARRDHRSAVDERRRVGGVDE